MSALPLLHPTRFFSLTPKLEANPKLSNIGVKRVTIHRSRREGSRVRCSNPSEEPSSHVLFSDEKELSILRRWDVPWDWKVTALVMMPYLMSIGFAGLVALSGPEGVRHSRHMLNHLHYTDEEAIRMFLDQLLKAVVKLSVLYVIVRPHLPFPADIFVLKWRQPLDPQKGWILWACIGLLVASSAVFLLKILISSSDAGQTQNEAEGLVSLLPLIGFSNVGTACLLGMVGIVAPICEETLYRGFLLTSLTKWFPLPVSVVLSSAVFTFGHQSPGKSLEIFIFGIVLGLVYSQTRNLLAPITMHACWNSGVILFLTYLQSHGQDIQKYLK